MSHPSPSACPFCGARDLKVAFVYRKAPQGETRFAFTDSAGYYREFRVCAVCGHYLAVHDLDLTALYEQDYVSSTYGADGIRRNFDRINALPPERSDNVGRVQRVNEWAAPLVARARASSRAPTVLDVGSGLCVFLHRMKQQGWDGTALEPDERFAAHAAGMVGVRAVRADFMKAGDIGQFDLVTFNKVLEHVLDPVAMLAASRSRLRPGGCVYVELPDGEMAAREGAGREEFFVEHYHAFSMASLALLARQAGFAVQILERLREPSSKYTLRTYLAAWES